LVSPDTCPTKLWVASPDKGPGVREDERSRRKLEIRSGKPLWKGIHQQDQGAITVKIIDKYLEK